MEDAPFPSVAGDAQGTPQRRSGLRLSDAETVATTRLDMFGDNALKDALTNAPPNPAETGASNGAAPEAPADQPPPFLDAAIVSAGPASPEPAATEAVAQPIEAPAEPVPSDDPQHLDAAHDADQAADVARDLAPPAVPYRLQLDVPALDRRAAALPRPAASAGHLEFPPVFSALDEDEGRPQQQWNGENTSTQPLHEAQRQDDAVAEAAAWEAAAATDAEAPMAEAAGLEAPAAGEPGPVPPDAALAPELHGFSPPFPDDAVGGEPSDPSGPPPFREELAPPTPVFDAAAPAEVDPVTKIAAEADAAAQALESLKRLLETNGPDLEPVVRPMVHPEPMARPQPMIRPLPMADPDEAFGVRAYAPSRGEGLRIGPQTEAPSLAGTMAPMLPLPVPPQPERSRRGLYLLGFLSGLGLSLMTGIVLYFVLYFVINTTG